MIVESTLQLASQPLFLKVDGLLKQCPVYLKIEGLNIAGSIKLKTAIQIIDDLEAAGRLKPGGWIIESSSGNLGLALAIICCRKKYRFICVSDNNMPPLTRRLVQIFGAELVIVEKPDKGGGFLETRLEYIRERMRFDKNLIWTNQYANASNIRAHYQTTGSELLAEFPSPDWVFIGAGTTGTLGGCSARLKEQSPSTRIVAVDAVGSVTFGGKPGRRYLPGIGTSRRPEITDESHVDRVVMVPETSSVAMCRYMLAEHGLLVGPSTASVLAAVEMCAPRIRHTDTVVALSPDLGDRYVDTVYDYEWVRQHIGERADALAAPEDVLAAASA